MYTCVDEYNQFHGVKVIYILTKFYVLVWFCFQDRSVEFVL